MFKQGFTVDLIDVSGRTPLMIAAKHGHTDCVRVCLAYGADINAQDYTQGFTSAMFALKAQGTTMRALCEHGFDPSCMAQLGYTVADLADLNPMSPGALIFSAWRLALAESENLTGTLDAPEAPSIGRARL